jgi:hypothetical protein
MNAFWKGTLLGLFLFMTSKSGAPVMSEASALALHIRDRHAEMANYLTSQGIRIPPIGYDRASEYALLVLTLADRYGLRRELYTLILPYIDTESGWVNGTFDRHLKTQSFGLFGIQAGTAHDAASWSPALKHTWEWSIERWKAELIKSYAVNLEAGFALTAFYKERYASNVDRIYHALVAGPAGAARGVPISRHHFRRFQVRARNLSLLGGAVRKPSNG